MSTVFVITDGMEQKAVDSVIQERGVIRQPANIIWCDACIRYRRNGHQCEQDKAAEGVAE